MATPETFTWSLRIDSTAEVRDNFSELEFGDGYRQIVGTGINTVSEAWSVSIKGRFGGQRDISDIRDFINRHAGGQAFYWTPEGGEQGLYIVKNLRKTAKWGGMFELSWTMQQVFYP